MFQDLGVTAVPDAAHGAHFGHHARFRERYQNVTWSYHVIEAPANLLQCRYPRVGDSAISAGLMAGFGDNRESWLGERLVDMAHVVRTAFATGNVDWSNPSVRKLLSLIVAGREVIYGAAQTLMIEPSPGGHWLIEGNHRCLALIILGVDHIRGVDWSRVAPVPEETASQPSPTGTPVE